MKLLNRRDEKRVADAVIRDPEEHTLFDEQGAVRSVQAADLTMPAEALEAIWSPMHLERLARTYWKYLSRVTLGLIRVAYTPTERAVVFIGRPFVLLRFHAPEYTMDDERGVVRWRIRDGILVASEGHEGDGFLEIDITPLPRGRPGPRAAARRGRDRVVLSRDRVPDRALGLREHAVADPRAGHARLPALARAARARGVRGRPLRRPETARGDGPSTRRSTSPSATRRGRLVGALAAAGGGRASRCSCGAAR